MTTSDIMPILIKAVTAIVAACFTLEITPIKINPVSWFCKRVAANVNKERDAKINDIEESLKNHIEQNDKHEALAARTNIIKFAEDLKMKHIPSAEHFDIILDDINYYEAYCAKNPDFPNNKCVLSMKMIKDCYESYILKGTDD